MRLRDALRPLRRMLGAYRAVKDRVLVEGTPARALYDRITGGVRLAIEARLQRPVTPETAYQRWRAQHEPPPEALAEAYRHAASPAWPRVSVLLAARGDAAALRRSIVSVAAQLHPDWQLCIGHEGTAVALVAAAYAARDGRVRAVAATGGDGELLDAAAALATGEAIALLGCGDTLAPDALWRLAERFAAGDDVVYSDEDRLDADGERGEPFFKPDWSPELLSSMDYTGGLLAARAALFARTGGLRAAPAGAERYDLALRLTDASPRVGHVPQVLYHARRRALPEPSAAQRALAASAARRGWPAEIDLVRPGVFRTRHAIAGAPKVAVIIPTRDKHEILRTCIDSIVARSTYRAYEIVVVDNGSTDPASLAYLAGIGPRHRVLADPRPFNWSALNNHAARQTDAPFLLFLNNDVEVITPGWLEAMIEHAQRPEVGPVGAKLLYPDGKVQHAGVILGMCGTASHAFRQRVDDGREYFALLSTVRNYSAVTGACLMVRREVFDALGGFDEALRVAYNDVDFCLRAGERGLRSVYTPHAALYHYESATRGALHPPENEALFIDRWRARIAADPFHGPNLSLQSEDLTIRA